MTKTLLRFAIGCIFAFVFIFVLACISAIRSPGASAKDNTPRGEPTTTTTVPSWPKPHVHTISKNNSGEANMPNALPYWWHGTIDGKECILVANGDHPALACDFSAK